MQPVVLFSVVAVVLLGAAVWGVAALAVQRGRGAGAVPVGDLGDRVRRLCAQGRNIQAIKMLREEIPGLGLKQAKDAVDAVAAGTDLATALGRADHRIPRLPELTPDLAGKVQALLAENKKIQAIKLVREQIRGLGLKQAKALVDDIEAGRLLVPPPTTRPAVGPDLAGRVRSLKAEGRVEQAVFLVRGETGMNEAEATSFVAAVEPQDHPI